MLILDFLSNSHLKAASRTSSRTLYFIIETDTEMSFIMPESVTDEDILNLKKAGYSEKAIGYYLDQTNLGTMDYPDIKHIQRGQCGDIMFLYINLCQGPSIQEIKFKYIGCPALAASGASMTKLTKGRTLLEASEITEKDIMNDIESLPDDHLHCPVLAIQTLRGALDVLKNKKLLSKEEHDDYIHPCGLTGKQMDEHPPMKCENCAMVRECEEDHIILRKKRINKRYPPPLDQSMSSTKV